MDKKDIQPMSKKELAAHYGITPHTLRKWLEPLERKIGLYSGRKFTKKQLAIIFQYLDY